MGVKWSHAGLHACAGPPGLKTQDCDVRPRPHGRGYFLPAFGIY